MRESIKENSEFSKEKLDEILAFLTPFLHLYQ